MSRLGPRLHPVCSAQRDGECVFFFFVGLAVYVFVLIFYILHFYFGWNLFQQLSADLLPVVSSHSTFLNCDTFYVAVMGRQWRSLRCGLTCTHLV